MNLLNASNLRNHNQIFISYARKNQAAVDPIYLALRKRGYNVWMDRAEGSIDPSEQWEKVLKAEIEASYAMIICLSPDYLSREWCEKEWRYAHSLGKKLYILRLAAVDESALPDLFQTIQHVRLDLTTRPNDYNREMNTVTRQLRRPWMDYALLLIALVIVLAAGLLVWKNLPRAVPSPEEFHTVRSNHGMVVTDLAEPADSSLFFMASMPEGGQWLNSLDMRQGELANTAHQIMIEEQVWDLMVDCGKVPWVLVEGGLRILGGTLTPASELRPWGMSRNTLLAATSRCTGDERQIWMARDGIYSLTYTTDPREFTAIDTSQDPVHTALAQADFEVGNIVALLQANGTLWALDAENHQVISIPLDSAAAATSIPLESTDPPVDFDLAPDGSLWVLTASDLFHIQENIVDHTPLPDDMNPGVLAVDDTWIWLGERCEGTENCRALTVFREGNITEIDIQQNTINDIFFDPDYGLWIATENGVVFRSLPS